jgi:hypothetical protein
VGLWKLATELRVPQRTVAAATIVVLLQATGPFVGLRTWYLAFMVLLAHRWACRRAAAVSASECTSPREIG